jgi:hypothetical protein
LCAPACRGGARPSPQDAISTFASSSTRGATPVPRPPQPAVAANEDGLGIDWVWRGERKDYAAQESCWSWRRDDLRLHWRGPRPPPELVDSVSLVEGMAPEPSRAERPGDGAPGKLPRTLAGHPPHREGRCVGEDGVWQPSTHAASHPTTP